jgi:hypothetical protein
MKSITTSTELLVRFRDDHQRLRGKANVLRSLALQVIRGDRELEQTLILKGRDLNLRLIAHMRWEEETLLPHLSRRAAGGGEAVGHIIGEHGGQRTRIAHSLMTLGGGTPNIEEVAKDLLALTDWLERDMEAEERFVVPAMTPESETF